MPERLPAGMRGDDLPFQNFRGGALGEVGPDFHRFAAFCLRQQACDTRVRVEARLSRANQRRLQEAARKLMADFDRGWDRIHPETSRLTKITTYPL